MIDKRIREKIEALAYEKYEWRKENGISGCALGDWLDAEAEILIDRRQIEGCPKHGNKLRAQENNTIICLMAGCDWNVPARRKTDEGIPSIKDIKNIWQ